MQNVILSPETASKTLELARVNVDSSKGFLKAAEVVSSPTLTVMFTDYATERATFAEELKAALGSGAAQKAETGTLKAKVHRWWMELRSLTTGGGDFAILAEVERAEDQIKAAYEEVILDTVGSPVNDVLHAQLRRIKAGHDRIRALRDEAKS